MYIEQNKKLVNILNGFCDNFEMRREAAVDPAVQEALGAVEDMHIG